MINRIRCLGMRLDILLSARLHVKTPTTRTNRTANSISKMLPNIYGPRRASRCKLPMSIADINSSFSERPHERRKW